MLQKKRLPEWIVAFAEDGGSLVVEFDEVELEVECQFEAPFEFHLIVAAVAVDLHHLAASKIALHLLEDLCGDQSGRHGCRSTLSCIFVPVP